MVLETPPKPDDNDEDEEEDEAEAPAGKITGSAKHHIDQLEIMGFPEDLIFKLRRIWSVKYGTPRR